MTQQVLSIRFAADNRSLIVSTRESSNELRQFADNAQTAGNSLRNNFSGAARQGIASVSTQLAAAKQQLLGLVGVSIGVGMLKDLAGMADSASNLSSKLRNVTDSEEALGRVRERTFAIAQRTRASYEATAELYGRMTRATSELGLSEQNRLQITETINKAMVVSGASAQEANAAIIQLSQGLSAGALRGDEFNSVAEQAPILMDLLAKSLNMTRGELKAFAAEGKITAEVVTTALLEGGAQIDAQFGNMQLTISGAGQQLSNAMLNWIGDADRAAGVSEKFAGFISFVADNFDLLATAVVAVSGVVAFGLVASLAAAGVALAANAAQTRQLAAEELREATAAEASALAHRNAAASMAAAGLAAGNLTRAEAALAAAHTRTAAAAAASTSAMGVMRSAGAGLFSLMGGWTGVVLALGLGLAYIITRTTDTATALESIESHTAAARSSTLSLVDALSLLSNGSERAKLSLLELKQAQLDAIVAANTHTGVLPPMIGLYERVGGVWVKSTGEATSLRLEIEQLTKAQAELAGATTMSAASDVVRSGFAAVNSVIQQTINWRGTLTATIQNGAKALDEEAAKLDKHAAEVGKTKVQILEMAKANEVSAAAARVSAQAGSEAYKLITAEVDKKYKKVLASAAADEAATAAEKRNKESKQQLAGASRELSRDLTTLNQVIDDNNASIEDGLDFADELAASLGGPLALATRAYHRDLDTVAEALDALESQMRLGAITAQEYARAKARLSDAAADAGEAFDRETAAIARQGDVLGQYQQQVAADTAMVGLSERQRHIAEAVRDQTAAWRANEEANRGNQQSLSELVAGVESAAAAQYDYTAAVEANQEASREWAQAWQQGVAGVSDALGDLIASGLRDWSSFGDQMKSIATRFLSQIASQFMQAQFGQLLGLGGGGGSGPSFGQLFSMFGGGGGSTAASGGGMGSLGSISQLFGGGSGGGLGNLGNLGSLFGFGASGGAGGLAAFGGVASPAWSVASGGMVSGATGMGSFTGAGSLGWTGGAPGFGGTFGGGTGAYGAGAGTSGGGAGAAGMGAMGVAAIIAVAMMVNDSLYGKGWQVKGGQNSMAGEFATAGAVTAADRMFRSMGLDGRTASLLSGSSIHTALWGRKAPEVTGQGANFSFGADGASGETWADIKRKGGLFRSTKRWTEEGALDEDVQAELTAFWESLVRDNAAIARQVLGTAPDVVTASFRQERDGKGNITKEIGTIMGRDYLATWAEFQGVIRAENAIASAASSSAMLEVATPAQQTRTWDPETRRWTVEIQEAGTTLVNELQQVAERYRGSVAMIQEGASLLVAVQTDIARGNGLLGEAGAGALTQVVDLVEDLQLSGETLPAAYARISASAAMLDQALGLSGINLDATREQVVRFAAGIVDAAGGLDQAAALYDNFYSRFYTDEERSGYALQQATGSASTQFAAAGLELSDYTGEGGLAAFRELFEKQLPEMSAEQTVQYLELARALGVVTDLTAQYNATLGQSAMPVAQTGDQRQAVMAILDGNAYDAAAASMSAAERAVAEINQRFDEQQVQMLANAATAKQLTILEEQRTAALEAQQAALAAQRADILAGNDRDLAAASTSSADQAIAGINRRYDEQRAALVDLGATTAELTQLDVQRTAALGQQMEALAGQRESLLAGNDRDLAAAGMTDYELRLRDISARYDEQRATLEDLGATTEELMRLEGQRNTALQTAAQIEAERLAAAGVEYRNFIEGLWRETSNLSAFQREQFRIEDWQDDQIAAANAHARAAGMAGASEQALALIELRAAQMRAAAVLQLRSETQSLYDQLYGAAGGAGASMTAGMDAAGDAAADFWARQREQIQSLNDYLDSMLLGDLSALSPEEQISTAWQQLQDAVAAGDVDRATQLSDVYLRLLRSSTASGDDYNNGADGVAGFWDVRELLMGMRDGLLAAAPPESAGGGGGSSGGPTAEQSAALIAADRAQLAIQFAQHLNDLSGAINQPVLQLVEDMGVSLRALASDLGINLTAITGESVTGLASMASLLGINLTELTGELGLQLTSLGGGLRELATGLGIDLSALTTTSTQALGNLANQLGLDLTEVAGAVGISLGGLADSQSLLNEALGATIDGLPAGTRDELRPLLEAVENAATEADANAAIDALEAAVNLLAPDIRNQLAPYLADVFPASALSDLDYLSTISSGVRDQLSAIGRVEFEASRTAAATDQVRYELSGVGSELSGISRSMLDELQRIANNTEAENSASGVASYAVGTGTLNVQGDQLANIHHGEKVIDAQTSSFLDRYGIRVTSTGGGGNDAAVVATLQQGFRALQEQLDKVARNVERGAVHVADAVDGAGERSDGALHRAMDDMAYAIGTGTRGRG